MTRQYPILPLLEKARKMPHAYLREVRDACTKWSDEAGLCEISLDELIRLRKRWTKPRMPMLKGDSDIPAMREKKDARLRVCRSCETFDGRKCKAMTVCGWKRFLWTGGCHRWPEDAT